MLTPVSKTICMLGDEGNSDEIQIPIAACIKKNFYNESKSINRVEETREFVSRVSLCKIICLLCYTNSASLSCFENNYSFQTL